MVNECITYRIWMGEEEWEPVAASKSYRRVSGQPDLFEIFNNQNSGFLFRRSKMTLVPTIEANSVLLPGTIQVPTELDWRTDEWCQSREPFFAQVGGNRIETDVFVPKAKRHKTTVSLGETRRRILGIFSWIFATFATLRRFLFLLLSNLSSPKRSHKDIINSVFNNNDNI